MLPTSMSGVIRHPVWFLYAGFWAPLAIAASLGLTSALLDYVEARYGKAAVERLYSWQELAEQSLAETEMGKLRQVNRFFNRLSFVDDERHWGRKDYWATPVEMLSTNGGDCEDFSIAKYFTLLEMGIPEARLRITYVKAVELNQAHMVLAYYESPSAIPLILDNLVDDILPADQRDDLVPVYSFNGDGLWLSVERGRGRKVGGSGRVSLWQDLIKRMQEEAEGRI